MAKKTYLDLLKERGIVPFVGSERFEELLHFDPKTQYAIPGQVTSVFKSPGQHQMELGRTYNLISDMCWYGASEEELFRAIKHGMTVLDADKHHLDWKKSAEDNGIRELYQKYRRFNRRPKLTEHEKLVISAYTGYVLEGTFGKVTPFVEEVLGHSIRTPEPPETPIVVEVRKALKEEFCEICRRHHIFEYL